MDGALDVAGAVLSIAGAGVGGRAVRIAMEAKGALTTAEAAVSAARGTGPVSSLTGENAANYWSALKSASAARRTYEVEEGLEMRWNNRYGVLGGTSLPFETIKLAHGANECEFGCG